MKFSKLKRITSLLLAASILASCSGGGTDVQDTGTGDAVTDTDVSVPAAPLSNPVAVTENGVSKKVGTGYVVTSEGGGESAVVVIYGDVDGSGSIDATDYLSVKKHFLKQINVEGVYAIAANTDQKGTIDATDYLKIKNHFLGTNLLY